MELKILKNISNNDLEFFTKFLERNLHLKEVLTEYGKISYLDDINKFFFLFKNRESLRNSNYDFFLYYKEKTQSILHLFFALSNPRDFDKLRFRLSSEEDATLFVDMFLQIEIYRTLENIAQRNALFTKTQKKKRAFLVNNFSLLQISPFIFHKEELKEIIEEEIKKFPEENIFNLNFENDSLDLVYSSISERTNLNYIKIFNRNYNNYQLRFSGSSILTEDELIIVFMISNHSEFEIDLNFTFAPKYRFNYSTYETEMFVYKELDKMYKDPDSSIEIDEKINIENLKKSIDFLNTRREEQDRFINDFYDFWNLKKVITNISEKNLLNYFESFFEVKIENKDKRLNLKLEIKNFLKIFYDNKIKTIPKIVYLNSKDLQDLTSFFRYLKNEKIINYPVKEFLKMLLNSSGVKIELSTLEQAHKKIKLTEDEISLINKKYRFKINK